MKKYEIAWITIAIKMKWRYILNTMYNLILENSFYNEIDIKAFDKKHLGHAIQTANRFYLNDLGEEQRS